jgi:DNA-binding CsgD family transcriptional regulator
MDFITDQTASFIHAVQEAKDTNELLAVLEETLEGLGVPHFALYEFTGKVETGTLSNYPLEWGHRYVNKRYETLDPVTLKLFNGSKGFFWDEKIFGSEGALTGRSKTVFHEGSDFGLREGYAYLMANVNGQSALTSYGGEALERDPKMLQAMHLISLYVHGKFKELTTPSQPPVTAPYLTPRERECLLWAGHGKTNWEIAQILAVKETTVLTHIENAKKKLNSPTKIQAVVRSMQLGVIQL